MPAAVAAAEAGRDGRFLKRWAACLRLCVIGDKGLLKQSRVPVPWVISDPINGDRRSPSFRMSSVSSINFVFVILLWFAVKKVRALACIRSASSLRRCADLLVHLHRAIRNPNYNRDNL